MGQPVVAEAFAEDPTLLPDAIAGRLATQQALGIKPEDRRVLTKSEEQEIFEGIRNLPPEQQAAALASFRGRYGDGIGPVAAALEEAGLPPFLAAHLDPSSDPAPVRPVSEVPEPPGGSFESDIISETAQRLLAEGEAAGEPRAVEQDQSGIAAGQVTQPPLPRRKPGSGPHPAEQKLLDKYRPLMEADEATLREGLDASRVKGIEAIVESKVQEQGVRSEVAELTKRLALRNYRRGGGLESAASSALIETGVEQPNLSLDTSRYMPPLTGDAVADAHAYMDRMGMRRHNIPPGAAETVLARLKEAANIRSIEKEQGEQGLIEFEQRMAALSKNEHLSENDKRISIEIVKETFKATATPYEHPWSLNDPELGTAIVFLARKFEALANNSLWKGFVLFLLDTVPFTKWGGAALSGMKRTLDTVGVIDDLNDEEASNILLNLVLEAMHRGYFVYDISHLRRLGLDSGELE